MTETAAASPEMSESYKKAKESLRKATSEFEDVETIGAKEVLQLQEQGKKVLLVDVRTVEEMEVSMVKGAVTREAFEESQMGESARTGKKFAETSADSTEWDVVVPYCTAGYRSGEYGKKLKNLGYPAVRNGEGVVLWTHDIGSGLVAPEKNNEREGDGGQAAGDAVAQEEVKRVHVYAAPWDNAREDFETVKFTATGWLGSAFRSFARLFTK